MATTLMAARRIVLRAPVCQYASALRYPAVSPPTGHFARFQLYSGYRHHHHWAPPSHHKPPHCLQQCRRSLHVSLPSPSPSSPHQRNLDRPKRVAILGSGNFGSAMAKIVGDNVARLPEFDSEVSLYVREEQVNGTNLTQWINTTHENPKYLPGISLPPGVRATSNLIEAATQADFLIFVVPHQFVRTICDQLRGIHLKPGVKAISLIKGLDVSTVDRKTKTIQVFPQVIQDQLHIPCLALSGANIANEVARGLYAESTLGYPSQADFPTAQLFVTLFGNPTFRIQCVPDVQGVALAGALKNIVAIAAGISDGLQLGSNTKAALMRIGLGEMIQFGTEFFDRVQPSTFLQTSAGLADLITTCFGGRNRQVAEAFVRRNLPFDQLERELLGGQKLQGVQTAYEVYEVLAQRQRTHAYPLFTAVYQVAYQGRDPRTITRDL